MFLPPRSPSPEASSLELSTVRLGVRKGTAFAGARPLYERALVILEKVLGAEHPHTGRCQSNYARLALMTDRPAEALQLARAALAAHERVNGPNHPWTKDSAGATAERADAA
jgi:hypothetical protein